MPDTANATAAPPSAWPATLTPAQVHQTHPEYDPATIQLHNAMYAGGRAFDAIADRVLVKRALEEKEPRLYAARRKRSYYIPDVAVIDGLVAAVFQDEPRWSESSGDYWTGLNTDCDGTALDLAALARKLLYDLLLHRRAWLALSFPPGSSDAQWLHYPVAEVDDWDDNSVRLHTTTLERPSLLDKPEEAERLTFHDAKAAAVYRRTKDAATLQEVWKLESVTDHEYGRRQVYEVRLPYAGLWLMNRIEPVLRALYNRRSAHTWSLDCSAFALLVVLAERELKDITMSEVYGLHLRPGESAQYIAPPPSVAADNLADISRLRGELAATTHTLALEVAAKQQAPRAQTGATALQRAPLDALLAAYAAPIRDVFERAAADLAEFRREPAPPVLEGFSRFGAVDLDALAGVTPPGGVTPVAASAGAAKDKPGADEET